MKPIYDRLVEKLKSKTAEQWLEYDARAKKMRETLPGWANGANLGFFEEMIDELPCGASVLVCGVYHGMDLKMMADRANFWKKRVNLYGVDLFANQPYPDWNEDQKKAGSTWEKALGFPPPSIEAARENCPQARFIVSRSSHYMQLTPRKFDVIYLDTAHDYENVKEEIKASKNCLKPDGLLSGDDYKATMQNYGVDRAVIELCPEHQVLFDRVWISRPT